MTVQWKIVSQWNALSFPAFPKLNFDKDFNFLVVCAYIIKTELWYQTILQENAMRYNNRDDLLQLSFTLKISIFSKVYI